MSETNAGLEAKSTPDNTGRKDDAGKAPIALIPHVAILEEARAFEDGRKKYGTWNYMRGMAALRIMSAVFRHCWAWLWGETYAPDSGVHHLGHARAGLAMLLQLEAEGKLIDDRYAAGTNLPEQATAAVEANKVLQLEVGKWYQRRKGDVVQLVATTTPTYIGRSTDGWGYFPDGHIWSDRHTDPYDIVAQVPAPKGG